MISMHKELFQYNHLLYGLASAPAIHQRALDGLLQDIPGMISYQDDIFINSKYQGNHLQTLKGWLRKREGHGFRLNKDECALLQTSIVYLEHQIGEEGLHPMADKVEAV